MTDYCRSLEPAQLTPLQERAGSFNAQLHEIAKNDRNQPVAKELDLVEATNKMLDETFAKGDTRNCLLQLAEQRNNEMRRTESWLPSIHSVVDRETGALRAFELGIPQVLGYGIRVDRIRMY